MICDFYVLLLFNVLLECNSSSPQNHVKCNKQTDPDKWRSDNDHDMTIEETEEHFKGIVNAYDHFISNINNNDSDDSEDFVHVDRDED